jgi:hypothetical protein
MVICLALNLKVETDKRAAKPNKTTIFSPVRCGGAKCPTHETYRIEDHSVRYSFSAAQASGRGKFVWQARLECSLPYPTKCTPFLGGTDGGSLADNRYCSRRGRNCPKPILFVHPFVGRQSGLFYYRPYQLRILR